MCIVTSAAADVSGPYSLHTYIVRRVHIHNNIKAGENFTSHTICTNYIPIHARARARPYTYINTSIILLYTPYMILYTRLMRNNSVNVFIPQRLVYIIHLAAAAMMVSGGRSGGDDGGGGERMYRVSKKYTHIDERNYTRPRGTPQSVDPAPYTHNQLVYII